MPTSPAVTSPRPLDERNLFAGLTTGAKLATDTLFSRGPQLVIDASHVRVVRHEGLAVIPVAEVFADPSAVFLGFGYPNVYLALPRRASEPKGRGWDRYAAFMFWREKSYVADTKGRVQGGLIVELRGLPPEAIDALRDAMVRQSGRRTITCANATAKVLDAAGFTCRGRQLKRSVRPMRLARRIWEGGLEFRGARRRAAHDPHQRRDHQRSLCWSHAQRAHQPLPHREEAGRKGQVEAPRPGRDATPAAGRRGRGR